MRAWAIAGFALVALGCGARSNLELGGSAPALPDASGAGAGGSVSIVDASTEAPMPVQDASSDPAPPPNPLIEALLGRWMALMIGDCINAEEWLEFLPNGALVVTNVDRNFCAPHSVASLPGSWQVDGPLVRLAYPKWDASYELEFSVGIATQAAPLPAPLEPGYIPGSRRLPRGAYVGTPGGTIFERHVREHSAWDGSSSGSASDVRLELALPLASSAGGTNPCKVKLGLEVSIESEPVTAIESFDLDCHYETTAQNEITKLVVDGLEESTWGWTKFLQAHGIYDKYPTALADAVSQAFYPVLFFELDDSSELFSDQSWWWYEMLSPPPAGID